MYVYLEQLEAFRYSDSHPVGFPTSQEYAPIRSHMRQHWLRGSGGMVVVAIGIVATCCCFAIFTPCDIWFALFGEDLLRFSWLREQWFVLPAEISAVFCVFTFFIWRSALLRISAGLVAAAMASHVIQIQSFFRLSTPEFRTIAICRVLVSLYTILGLIFLGWRERHALEQK